MLSLKCGKPIRPYRIFLSGPGGVGKSHVIRIIQSDTLKILRLSGALEPDDIVVLLTAPTGVAAFNIGGMTLHSAFLLGCSKFSTFQPLGADRLNTLRSRLSHLALLIIDEISMVGSTMLLEIHKRLQQIKGVGSDVLFGGISILAVGDLYQLPPVGQSPLFSLVKDSYAQLYGFGSLWVDEFQMIELDEIVRQRDDTAFSKLLRRVRINECSPKDIEILTSRVITSDTSDYPVNALHVYRLNADVDHRNNLMLNSLASETSQYVIRAKDTRIGQTTHINLTDLSDKRSETGGLHCILRLAVGAHVMLTTNIDVSDGLVNGARGEVIHISTTTDRIVTHILVKFDNPRVGLKAIQSSPYRSTFITAVPLTKCEVTFMAKGKRGSEITRLQFPLTLAWATTIHKVQGLTLEEIVVDMKGGHFSAGQAYVALSRVKTLQCLHILNFDPNAIRANSEVKNEMARLSTKMLEITPGFDSFVLPDKYISVALLNVRSLLPKLPDIEQDNCLKCANIVCFCETWLSSPHPSPIIRKDHQVLRCDRTISNNKGGTMISVPQYMQPSDTNIFMCTGMEGISTTLLLPNTGRLRLTLLYRSPNVPIDTCINFLIPLLSQLSQSHIPSIVMGDFNENLMDRSESKLSTLMANSGYTQLVQTPTTDKGTLIDYVYYNRVTDDPIIHVYDTYYSDHDIVHLALPMINDPIRNHKTQ